jgi:predicted  nucleic acid-binding Zn-ribbon protein
MSASNGEVKVSGQQRDLMIQAAMAYDETQKRIASLEDQLNRAIAALEAKNAEIDNLNLLLSQERNRNDNHRNERDQAVAERAEVLAILSNVRAMVEKAEIPVPPARKRNGNGNVVAVSSSEQPAIGGGRKSSTERRLSVADASQAELAS